jgi:ABC-type uncharacterized transport system ATPase subunit
MTTTSISPYVVETSGLTKRFGERTVVRDVELRVPRGSAFGYLGPNGEMAISTKLDRGTRAMRHGCYKRMARVPLSTADAEGCRL